MADISSIFPRASPFPCVIFFRKAGPAMEKELEVAWSSPAATAGSLWAPSVAFVSLGHLHAVVFS